MGRLIEWLGGPMLLTAGGTDRALDRRSAESQRHLARAKADALIAP